MCVYKKYCKETFDSDGRIKKFELNYPDNFNFGYDVVDEIANESPEKRALVWCNTNNEEREFTFGDIKHFSNKVANVFKNAGLKRGDRVIVILKRHYEYWFVSVALHKLGVTLIPATHMLTVNDLEYRIKSSECKAIVCTPFSEVPEKVYEAVNNVGREDCLLWTVQKEVEGFRNLNNEMSLVSDELSREETNVNDPMLIYYTSGTTGYPKGVIHDFTYPLAHIVTAKYWHQAEDNGLHFTIAEIGWAKASWGKIYGQWLVGSAVMVCDFDNFDPKHITSIINKYGVTSFCAPPTFFRFLVLKDIPKMPLLKSVATGGEALAPEVYKKFYEQTGLVIREGYGQSETTFLVGNIYSDRCVAGSMGYVSPFYNVELRGKDNKPTPIGEIGEIVVVPPSEGTLPGIVRGYVGDEDKFRYVFRDGVYHTGDSASMDNEGRIWFHGRFDDVIKTGGYRVGPCEIENVIMEYPSVVECCVVGVPDTLRGQAIKAYVKLDKDSEPTKEMEKDVKDFCNNQLAEYKWIRMVEFVSQLPKTASGKIRKVELRELNA